MTKHIISYYIDYLIEKEEILHNNKINISYCNDKIIYIKVNGNNTKIEDTQTKTKKIYLLTTLIYLKKDNLLETL